MIYKSFQDVELSMLGFGTMRMPCVNGVDAEPDMKGIQAMVGYAMSHGVNYFDTAWGYHEGHSEEAIGKALSRFPREKYYLADKFPGYDLNNMDKVEEIFEAQLKRCGVDYFDFYLFHNVCEMNIKHYLDPKNGIVEYLLKQKEAGRIRHLGFSTHGELGSVREFLDVMGDSMEFCQIQLNWLDHAFQKADQRLELLNSRNVPVWVMEPVRGGRLLQLDQEALNQLAVLNPNRRPVEWAFRFIQSMPGVTMVLSGMSNMPQMKDNIAIFEKEEPTTDAENQVLFSIAKKMTAGVPCTACRYCVDHCPNRIDIPYMIRLYNENTFTGGGFRAPLALKAIEAGHKPQDCEACGACAAVCPQKIDIPGVMKDFSRQLLIPPSEPRPADEKPAETGSADANASEPDAAAEKPAAETAPAEEKASRHFIQQFIDRDLAEGVYDHVHTRFPPEPNGYLHIGHAKSIILNSGIAKEYGGKFNLRFDDTNPTKEKSEFVESIMADVKWLGADWEDRLFFASNYFDQMYEYAIFLIKKGKAYISSLNADEIREYRGTLTEPGKDDPDRERPMEESLRIFTGMKDGKYEDGSYVLRAKIDMASPNINMRDPIIYRVAHMTHHNTGDKWCIYPMYDFAHPIEDAIEGITHSLCTLEFEDHRPLYDWVVNECEFKNPPRQIEFAKMYLKDVVTGKRYIKKLVEQHIVDGWDDPRLVSISGLRRRGYTPESIRMFVEMSGISKSQSVAEVPALEYCIREDLKLKVSRYMAILDPVKVVIDNYPEGQVEYLDVENNLENPELGKRQVPFTREIFIEREDFMENPPKKYFRLFPGNEVRLMNAYFITCTGIEKDADGNITLIHCTYDPATRSGTGFEGRKVKGTIQWVSATEGRKATVRLYENIIDEEKGMFAEDGSLNLNPRSCVVCENAVVEPELMTKVPYDRFQFVRTGYFCVDAKDSAPGAPVFNRIVALKSSFKL